MVARLQWSAFGLRGRIVGAVLVTTVVTLGVAALVLLPRLENSLKTAEKNALRSGVKTAIRSGAVSQIAQLHYIQVAMVDAAGLGRSPLRQRGFFIERRLNDALTSLKERLGAGDAFLVGYVDASGRGKLVQLGPDRDAAVSGESALLDAAQQAWRSRVQSIISVSPDQQSVLSAIPIRSDDAVIIVRASIVEIPSAVHAVGRAFEIAALAGLLLTALLAIPLAATLVRRLQRLRQAALRVAVEGTGAEFPIDRARDEVGDLARSFAIMNRRLRSQEEARRAFVATASHELRTPLASLDGMLELLGEDLHDPQPDLEDALALLERARAQSRRLGRLAADLLDLSRIDADVSLRAEPVELAELSRAVVAEFELAMGERGVGADLSRAAAPVWAEGDPGSIARILRILLDNAVRVAPRGSAIRIELAQSPGPTLRVSDSGPGVAPEERALIFERFKRGRDTGGEAGFGLGLAIGRELAERMGGTLELADEPGPGATFVLSLRPVRSGTTEARRALSGRPS